MDSCVKRMAGFIFAHSYRESPFLLALNPLFQFERRLEIKDNTMNKIYPIIFLLYALPAICWAQNDTLYLNKGDMIVGDLKGMDRGVLTIEPS